MNLTDPDARAARAHALWARADALRAIGRVDAAFALCTAAHDCVTDLPVLHAEAHRRLLPLDVQLGRRRDVFVDRLLLALRPVGVFTLLAWYFRVVGVGPCAEPDAA